MRVLLDTHALMWWLMAPERLSSAAREAIEDADDAWVSAVSIYEIDFKRQETRQRGLDSVLLQMPNDMPASLPRLGLQLLAITPDDAWNAARLPLHHRDPWDRLLVAQAKQQDLALVSRDAALQAYNLTIVW